MTIASPITWVLEPDVFANGDCIRDAAADAGHRLVDWSDEWWARSTWPKLDGPIVFHGSLGNADRVARDLPWKPGAYCNTEKFRCSAWYPAAAQWLLHDQWEILPASQFVREAAAVTTKIGGDQVFVRPDSPLKPFAGRVLHREKVSLAALDHGFYYDDAEIPVVVAPVRRILAEWRYVIAGNEVIAGSGYIADGRAATPDDPRGRSWKFAASIAEQLPPPDPVYVLDVCESEYGLRLLELNPFSGADLYACSGPEIVRRITAVAEGAI